MVLVLRDVNLKRDRGIWGVEIRTISDRLASSRCPIEFFHVEGGWVLMSEVSRKVLRVYGCILHGDIRGVVEVASLVGMINLVAKGRGLLMDLKEGRCGK